MIVDKLKQATEILQEGDCSFVLYQDEMKIHRETGIGLKPIMAVLRQDKRGFEGAVIADKVIGKAAALMVVLGGAEAVHGELMSKTAVEVLEHYQIPYTYTILVPIIENRTKTGMCPLEQSVQQVEDPEEAFCVIEVTIAELMRK